MPCVLGPQDLLAWGEGQPAPWPVGGKGRWVPRGGGRRVVRHFGPGTKGLLGPGPSLGTRTALVPQLKVQGTPPPTMCRATGEKPRLEKWVGLRAGAEARWGWLCPSGSEPGLGGCLGAGWPSRHALGSWPPACQRLGRCGEGRRGRETEPSSDPEAFPWWDVGGMAPWLSVECSGVLGGWFAEHRGASWRRAGRSQGVPESLRCALQARLPQGGPSPGGWPPPDSCAQGSGSTGAGGGVARVLQPSRPPGPTPGPECLPGGALHPSARRGRRLCVPRCTWPSRALGASVRPLARLSLPVCCTGPVA